MSAAARPRVSRPVGASNSNLLAPLRGKLDRLRECQVRGYGTDEAGSAVGQVDVLLGNHPTADAAAKKP
jgi:hypothetical protein